MQGTPLPPDDGFVVDWQMADDNPVLDLSTAESELIAPDDAATLRAPARPGCSVRAGNLRTV